MKDTMELTPPVNQLDLVEMPPKPQLFHSVKNAVTYIFQPEIQILLSDFPIALVLRLEVEDHENGLTDAELEKLLTICEESNIIIFLSIKDKEKYYIYWKSGGIKYFLILDISEWPDLRGNSVVFEYVCSHLVTSLKRALLGLHPQTTFGKNYNKIRIKSLADYRRYNLLLLATEEGNLEAIEQLLKIKLATECKNPSAQQVALKNQHFDILAYFLNANLPYPPEIKINECPDNIKKFHKISESLHAAIKAKDDRKLFIIPCDFPEIKHFYNLKNQSALFYALKIKRFEEFNQLVKKGLLFGPHEDFTRIKRSMRESDLKKLREIQYKDTEFLKGSHLNVLLGNSRIINDDSEPRDKYQIVSDAFKLLNENPFLQVILTIVAASRKFRVVFDFRYDSVEFIDPTVIDYTKGISYLTGRIYIGAKYLLDPVRKYEVLGILMQQLSYQAMNVVFRNNGKPYFKEDIQSAEEFKRICHQYKDKQGYEDIIDTCLRIAPHKMQEAELIVRVPRLIALNINNLERLHHLREIFWAVFNFFQYRVVHEIQGAHSRVKARGEKEMKGNKRWILWILVGIVVVIFINLIAAFLLLYRNMRTADENECLNMLHNFDKLAENLKNKFFDLRITFRGEFYKILKDKSDSSD